MGMFFGKKKKDEEVPENGAPSKKELLSHHVYEDEIIADGFLSPIVLPNRRIAELKGDMSLLDMSNKCHISMRELSILLENDYIEPTTSQLLSLSVAYNVSILWLLGYHTEKEIHAGSADADILSAVSKRNAIEQARQKMKKNGFIAELLQNRMGRRIMAANLNVASVAAHSVAKEHIPLDEITLSTILGQPVYVQQAGYDEGAWGIVEQDSIHIQGRDIPFSELGQKFSAYQMPKLMSVTLF